ncbi:Methyltransferase type 12 domain protein, partial [mine drainage metagenome]
MDLGAGSGKVESLLFERIPGIRVVGVDNSSAMLDLARARLQPYGDRFLAVPGDVACLSRIALPTPNWRAVIAVQSLHHLAADEMRSVYGWVYAHLQPGGLFLLLDRLQVVSEATFWLMRSAWLRLDHLHGTAG